MKRGLFYRVIKFKFSLFSLSLQAEYKNTNPAKIMDLAYLGHVH